MEKRKDSPVPFSFIARIQEDATAKSKRKDIANFFQVKEMSSVIGLTATNKLIVSFDSLSEFGKISERLKDCTNNDYAISCITDFEEFLPNVYEAEESCNYKIKLIDYQNYEQNILAIKENGTGESFLFSIIVSIVFNESDKYSARFFNS